MLTPATANAAAEVNRKEPSSKDKKWFTNGSEPAKEGEAEILNRMNENLLKLSEMMREEQELLRGDHYYNLYLQCKDSYNRLTVDYGSKYAEMLDYKHKYEESISNKEKEERATLELKDLYDEMVKMQQINKEIIKNQEKVLNQKDKKIKALTESIDKEKARTLAYKTQLDKQEKNNVIISREKDIIKKELELSLINYKQLEMETQQLLEEKDKQYQELMKQNDNLILTQTEQIKTNEKLIDLLEQENEEIYKHNNILKNIEIPVLENKVLGMEKELNKIKDKTHKMQTVINNEKSKAQALQENLTKTKISLTNSVQKNEQIQNNFVEHLDFLKREHNHAIKAINHNQNIKLTELRNIIKENQAIYDAKMNELKKWTDELLEENTKTFFAYNNMLWVVHLKTGLYKKVTMQVFRDRMLIADIHEVFTRCFGVDRPLQRLICACETINKGFCIYCDKAPLNRVD